MKRVLITGANSFLGNNTKSYLEKNGDYQVDILDMLNDKWKEYDFSGYDAVFNVCAIVHRPDEKDDTLYYKVNRDLAVEVAKKAKESSVRQFIQVSTNGVFGIDMGVMSANDGFKPRTPYEKSKYEADCMLEKMRDDDFKICIIRPPLMYGKGCKGNFVTLEKFALTKHVFPSLTNKRDFIFIENMTDFVRFAIDYELNEICYPRDDKTICVSKLIKEIADLNGNAMHLWSIFNPFVKLFSFASRSLKLVFGDCYCVEKICSKQWTAPYTLANALDKMYKGS